MRKLPLIWKSINENIDLTDGGISTYPICYTTDLKANIPKNKFDYKTASASGSDPDKITSVEKALMELVERVVFIKNMDINYTNDMGKINSKGWACHFDKEQAKEQAKLEFYEDYCARNFANLYNACGKLSPEKSADNDFNFTLLKIDGLFFSAAWFIQGTTYTLGSACAPSSALAYKKALEEAYVKWQARSFKETSKAPIIFKPGCHELDAALPKPRLEPIGDKLLEKLRLYVYRAELCEKKLH